MTMSTIQNHAGDQGQSTLEAESILPQPVIIQSTASK